MSNTILIHFTFRYVVTLKKKMSINYLCFNIFNKLEYNYNSEFFLLFAPCYHKKKFTTLEYNVYWCYVAVIFIKKTNVNILLWKFLCLFKNVWKVLLSVFIIKFHTDICHRKIFTGNVFHCVLFIFKRRFMVIRTLKGVFS